MIDQPLHSRRRRQRRLLGYMEFERSMAKRKGEMLLIKAVREALTLHTYWHAVKHAERFACFVPLRGRIGCSNDTLLSNIQKCILVIRMLGDQIKQGLSNSCRGRTARFVCGVVIFNAIVTICVCQTWVI